MSRKSPDIPEQVLTLFSASEELACATGNIRDSGGASVEVPLEEGQPVLVVVDGMDNDADGAAAQRDTGCR